MRTTLPIAQGFYVSDSLPISAQRCVNLYPNVPQTSTITDANLFSVDGIETLISGDVLGKCRGAHTFAGIPYFVIGGFFYRLDQSFDVDGIEFFTLTLLGLIDGIDRVYMADNGLQLCIVAVPDEATAGKSYIYTSDPDALTEITDANFDGPASSVVYSSGYFIFHKSDGKKFFNSPLNEGLTGYDALDFNVAESDPDQIRGLGVLNDQLYVFGSETIQLFNNIGRVPSPFAPRVGATINLGVKYPQTIQLFSGGLAFVGGGVNESPAVWIVAGGQRSKISTTAIDNELSKIVIGEDDEDVFSWVYAESGAYFYGISTPTTCFVYDSSNQRWHERQSVDGLSLTRYRVSHMVAAYDRIIVGDLQTGNVGALNEALSTEYGFITQRFVTSRPFDNQGSALNVALIEAVVESGVGLANDVMLKAGTNAAGQDLFVTGGADPQIVLSWSDDGGRIFEGYIPRSLGKIGQYNQRPAWSRLGVFNRQRVIQLSVSSPNKVTIIKVEADIG